MKQKLNYAVNVTALYLLLVFTGCKKEIAGSAFIQSSTSEEIKEKSTCRLVLNKDIYGSLNSFKYNNQGLLEKWTYSTSYGYKEELTVKYDNEQKIASAQFAFDGEAFRMEYLYENDRIVKEFWFVANTNIVDDTVLVTYNDQGQVIKNESLLYEYYSTFEYDAAGNANKIDVKGNDGYIYLSEKYYFTKKIKNPMLAVPGIPYALQYSNVVFSPYRFTGVTSAVTDENGNLVIVADYDPDKSVLKTGTDNFAISQNFYDNLSGAWYGQAWRYQNCDCGNEANNTLTPTDPAITSIHTNKLYRKYISSAGIRELVKAHRIKRK